MLKSLAHILASILVVPHYISANFLHFLIYTVSEWHCSLDRQSCVFIRCDWTIHVVYCCIGSTTIYDTCIDVYILKTNWTERGGAFLVLVLAWFLLSTFLNALSFVYFFFFSWQFRLTLCCTWLWLDQPSSCTMPLFTCRFMVFIWYCYYIYLLIGCCCFVSFVGGRFEAGLLLCIFGSLFVFHQYRFWSMWFTSASNSPHGQMYTIADWMLFLLYTFHISMNVCLCLCAPLDHMYIFCGSALHPLFNSLHLINSQFSLQSPTIFFSFMVLFSLFFFG